MSICSRHLPIPNSVIFTLKNLVLSPKKTCYFHYSIYDSLSLVRPRPPASLLDDDAGLSSSPKRLTATVLALPMPMQ